MYLAYFKDLKTSKDLKCPAARLTGNGASGFQQADHFSLKEWGSPMLCRINLILIQKPNRTLLG
jgi:hypothetical protein